LRYAVNRMTVSDLPRVIEIEKLAYPTSQWPASAYRRELQENALAHYIVARDTTIAAPPPGSELATRRSFFSLFGSPRQTTPTEDELASIVGYAGLWLMVDEAHVTTIAAHPSVRGRGVGELLLVSLIDIAYEIGARWVTLEVRVSNDVAQSLYQKYGFSIVSTRPRYYSDNNEDAYIMWTEEITSPAYRLFFIERKEALLARLARDERVAGNSSRSET
jgi:ribosomal-protein-alanine N-acetyltransferase